MLFFSSDRERKTMARSVLFRTRSWLSTRFNLHLRWNPSYEVHAGDSNNVTTIAYLCSSISFDLDGTWRSKRHVPWSRRSIRWNRNRSFSSFAEILSMRTLVSDGERHQSDWRHRFSLTVEEPFRSGQERDIKKVFTELDPSIPLVCVCGNHDVGDQPTRESIQRYVDNFGDDYFDFHCAGVHCIVINSQFYTHSANVEDLKLQHEQWLDKVLQEKSSKYVLVFQHIPWFLKSPDEEKDYFNTEISVRLKMLEKFHSAGVNKIFCGHYHRNAGGQYKSIEQIVTSAIGLQLSPADRSGVRLVRVTENDIQHQYFAIEDIPSTFLWLEVVTWWE